VITIPRKAKLFPGEQILKRIGKKGHVSY